jgi:hypothetical protein
VIFSDPALNIRCIPRIAPQRLGHKILENAVAENTTPGTGDTAELAK